ncbi:Nucleotide-binding universal stress protein, UspA family [Nonomuraea maritima]|uniref:Nucleotide-binding universal stress protein, UspA family n=1 Tax=Nonomuraea maritima TaxID=683260 RepID=A0A1G9M737_9ACTN|nr:universal stress protein [Nonomuraea maritima]SDL70059.1 Nucleotide-binding universal stress protein, UspA family [Nonomuraea maritima]
MAPENVLAGYVPDDRGRDALALALLLKRSTRGRLTVANVQPLAWSAPGPAKAEEWAWRAYLREAAAAALAQARELAGDDAEYVAHFRRGSGRGLMELARRRGADAVVIGSAPGGARGRITLGSTADQLLHASSVPVLLAPRGYGDDPPEAFERITVAYRRSRGCEAAVRAAVRTTAALGVPLRLVTLVVGARGGAERDLLTRLSDRAAADLRLAARGPRRRSEVEVEVLEGRTVAQALGTTSWLPGEMIICGSSGSGPLRRVFLGDTSIKIVKAAPCPVMVLTRQL